MTVIAFWKHLLSFLLVRFSVASCFLSNQESLYMILHNLDLFYVFKFFPIIFFWWIIYSFPVLIRYTSFNFYYSFRILPWFNMTVITLWKHLLSFLLIRFIVASCFLSNQESLYMILHNLDLFYVFRFFPTILFWWIIYSFPVLIRYTSFNFCYSFRILPWFNVTVIAFWKHLLSFFIDEVYCCFLFFYLIRRVYIWSFTIQIYFMTFII